MPDYPNHAVLYRLVTPEESSEPTAEPLVFDRLEDAWRHAAERVLSAPADPGEGDRVTVARDLLGMDDSCVLYGWVVSRWAKTMRHNRVAHQLSPKWSNGITLTHRDALDDTWIKVSTCLVRDLLRYSDCAGVDAAVITEDQVWLGIVVACTHSGHVTFADGQFLELDGAKQISVYLT